MVLIEANDSEENGGRGVRGGEERDVTKLLAKNSLNTLALSFLFTFALLKVSSVGMRELFLRLFIRDQKRFGLLFVSRVILSMYSSYFCFMKYLLRLLMSEKFL